MGYCRSNEGAGYVNARKVTGESTMTVDKCKQSCSTNRDCSG